MLALEHLLTINPSNNDNKRVANEVVARFIRRKLWAINCSMKWKVLLWKVFVDALPVGEEFRRRGLKFDSTCAVCGVETVETVDHLFRDCDVAQHIWRISPLGIRSNIGSECSLKEWICNWLNLLYSYKNGDTSILTFIGTLWTIWWNRNDMVFREHKLDFSKINNYATTNIRNALNGRESKKKKEENCNAQETTRFKAINSFPMQVVGVHGNCQCIRIKVDASWYQSGRLGMGWVAYQGMGTQVAWSKAIGWAETPLQGEAEAIKRAMLWAKQRGYLHLSLYSDCQQLILQWLGEEKVAHHIKGIVVELELLSAYFHCLDISFIPRSANKFAHSVAKKALAGHYV